jgi:hypothetical protein
MREKGQVQEKFLSLLMLHLTELLTDALYKHVVWVAQDYSFHYKIVSQDVQWSFCHVRECLMSIGKSKTKESHALFVHCYSRVINTVLQQSLSKIKECSAFFSNSIWLKFFLYKVNQEIPSSLAFL